MPLFLLDPADFRLDACRATMAEVRERAQKGPKFAVLDRLPLEEMSRDEAVAVYWLISSLLARPVAQKLNGQMFYDVMDTGAKLKPGSGIRPTVTNVDLRFHNDNSYNEMPPDYVCLFCLHPAKQGGISQVMSVATVHQALEQRFPELMPRLYQPFWYDRHAEHQPGEPTTFAAPIFERGGDGTIKARLALSEIYEQIPATEKAIRLHLHNLVSSGLIVEQTGRDDKRSKEIALTQRGFDALSDYVSDYKAFRQAEGAE